MAALTFPAPAYAEENVVNVDPAGIEVAPGGSVTVAIVDDPTPASTAIWAIDVVFDPGVISVLNPTDCDSINTPGGAIGAFDCQVIDTNQDDIPDTVKVLGVVLFTGSQTGLINVSTLADITFTIVGDPGQCSDLRLRIRSHADSEGQETGARVQDGRICIEADAPPSGTVTAVPFTPRTSEPTETPGPGGNGGLPTLPGGQQSLSPGQTRPTDQTGGGAGTGTLTGRSETPNGVGGGSGGPADDDDGASPLVYVGIAAVLAALAAGAAWAVIRLRSSGGSLPPGSEPPAS